LLSQKKETKEKATPLPLVSFGPRRFPSAAQAEGAARGLKVKTMRMP
jgi:hypothetical protein